MEIAEWDPWSFIFLCLPMVIGVLFQLYFLRKNEKKVGVVLATLILTRLLVNYSVPLIQAYWILPFSYQFSVFYLPGILAELMFNPLILLLYGNKLKSTDF